MARPKKVEVESTVETQEEALKALPDTQPEEAKISIIMSFDNINVSEDCKIKCKSNPKRVGSAAYARYSNYENSKTVAEYLIKGGWKADFKYDFRHGFLEIIEEIKDNKKIIHEIKEEIKASDAMKTINTATK